MKLPEEFLNKYRESLGKEFDAFLASFSENAVSAFRVNPLKKSSAEAFSKYEHMKESSFGYYGKVSGKSSEHVTGLVYSQEPAAQLVGELAAPKPGMRVLDVCAAPGGKTTHLLSFMENKGILVSNEISTKRSKILVENVERFGARNVVVLNESPERLAPVFKNYFDLIVLDAPCSGEGMFRKDPEAVQYWSADYPKNCAQLQREIIAETVEMLASDGEFVYSTCTWAPEEDEENVRWFLKNYPEFELVTQRKLWPHHFHGEGQFVAKFVRRTVQLAAKEKRKVGKSNLTNEQKQLWTDFKKNALLTELSNGILQVFGDSLYWLPEGLPDLSHLKIARNGLHLGTFKKLRFEPSFALGLALEKSEVQQSVEINEEQFKKYVRGETLSGFDRTVKNAWVQLTINGNGLGFAKRVDGTIKNYFPKGLRIY